MKRWVSKLCVIGFILAGMFSLTGCSVGTNVDTSLEINGDLSGVRKMDIEIVQSVFEEYFNGDMAQLNEIIGASCPEELVWTYDNSDGTEHYHLELPFTSPADYREKVEAILGEETTLELAAPTTVWANGFRISEGFTSTDLLEDIKTALIDGGMVDSSSASYIFGSGDNRVIFDGQTYQANSIIDISEIAYLPLNRIDILTAVNDMGLYDRTVVFDIPKSSMDAKKDDIEAFLNGNVSGSATSAWEKTETGSKMTVDLKNASISDMDAFTKQVLASENCEITQQDAVDGAAVFGFDTVFSEKFDVSSFAGNEWGTTDVRYFITSMNGIEIGENPDDWQYFSMMDSEEYPYMELWRDEFSQKEFSFLIEKTFLLSGTDVTTKVGKGDEFTRTSKFMTAEVPSQSQQQMILERVTARAGGLAEVTGEAGETGYTITITQKGNEEALAESSQQIFGWSSFLQYAAEKGLMKPMLQTGFQESFDYSEFITGVTDDFKMNYTADIGFLNFADKKSFSEESLENVTVKGSKVNLVTDKTQLDIGFGGSSINVIGIILWLILAVAVVVLAAGMAKTGVFAMAKADFAALKEKKAAGRAAVQPVPAVETDPRTAALMEAAAGAELSADPEQETYFCPNCGHKYPKGTAFCEECGTKLD